MKRIISGLLVVLILISNFPLIPVKAERGTESIKIN